MHDREENLLKIGLGGDLMIGRLVDEYLERAVPSYIWGNLRPFLQNTDLNIVNLETALTLVEKIVPKVFNFKARPERVAALIDGSIHAVNLANNHTLDFSEEGLLETIQTLDDAGILHVGAGENISQAKRPVIFERKGIKIGLLGCTDNEPTWKASDSQPGTNYLKVGDLEALSESINVLRKQVDVLIVSIHWGPNMVKRPTTHFRSFAHALIDLGVDILHGHSAHVAQGVEIYRSKLILYDTGELVDDYAVDPEMRNDRSFFFIVELDKSHIISLKMIPILISRFQVNLSQDEEQLQTMQQLCRELGQEPLRDKQCLILTI